MAKGTTLGLFQGSWGLEDPKVLQASQAQMDSQAPLDFQDQLDPLETEGFQGKS